MPESPPPSAAVPFEIGIHDQRARVAAAKAISLATLILVGLLGSASFVLSFEALCHFAAESGSVRKDLAWLFPATVDGAIVIFSVSALRCSIVGHDVRWSMWLVVISTAASVVFNMAHAPAGLMPALVGATPPLLLFLSFESLLRQVSSSLGGQHSLRDLLPPVKRRPAARAPKPSTSQALRPAIALEAKKQEALQLLRGGAPKRQVARQLGLGVATVRRLATLASA